MYDKKTNSYLPTMSGLGMHVEIKDPDEKVVLSRMYSSEGRFSITSHTAGEHSICLNSNSTAWFGGGQLRVHLDIQVGEHANNYQEIAAKDKLTELQLRVRQLGLTGSLAEVTVGRARGAASLHQDGILPLGRLEGQLIESHDLSSSLENAFTGAGGDVHRAQRQLRDLVKTKVVGDGAHDNGGLSITAWLLHNTRDPGNRHGRSVNATHIETCQNNLIELGVSSASQEPIELHQQTQIDILALGLCSARLAHVLVTDVDSHL